MESDEEIVRRVRRGQTQLFNELVLRHQKRLYGLAFRILGNPQDASEVVQSSFFSSYKKIASFKGKSNFFTWLYRIALNECYKKLKYAKYEMGPGAISLDELLITEEGEMSRVMADEGEPLPREEVAAQELRQIVRDALKKLPLKEYQVVLLKDIEGHSYKEIAGILRCRKGTVMSRLFRARRRLRRHLEKLHAEL